MDSSSAPGPDGITVKDLQSMNMETLSNMLSAWMLCGKVPEGIKGARSVLLPKCSEGLDQIGNWRPITISSVIIRLFTKILTARLTKVVRLSPRQRGFVAAPGCAQILFLIDTLVKTAKERRSPTDSHVIGLIKLLYDGSFTEFKVGDKQSDPLYFKKRVKQGDPLSPLLFNIAIDPLLRRLEEEEGFSFEIDGEKFYLGPGFCR